jgi:hypothetical protein
LDYRLIWNAIDELLGGGFDWRGQSPAQCYGIHARRSEDAPSRREFVAGGVIDADALIELGRSLQPLPPQHPSAASKTTHKHRGLAEDIERVRVMGAVRPPDEYDDWYPGAAAFKRAYPDDLERAFLLFDTWSSSSTKYEGPDDARNKFNHVPAEYEGHAIEVVVGMLYARAKRRAINVLKTLYPLYPGEIIPIADEFKKLEPGPLVGGHDAPQKGDEPIEPGDIKAEDGLIALEFLLFCHGEKSIEGIPIPPHVLEKAREATEARRERLDLNGRILHQWSGKNLATDTVDLADAIIDSGPTPLFFKVDRVLVRISDPTTDPAHAARLRKNHNYTGLPGGKGDPVQGGMYLTPVPASDTEAARAIIAERIATKITVVSGRSKTAIVRHVIGSFGFNSKDIRQSPDAKVLTDLCKRALPERASEIVGVITAPVMPNLPVSTRPEDLLRADTDHIITQAGYDTASRLYFAPIGTPGTVPAEPSQEQVREAVELLKYPLLDFPFARQMKIWTPK